MMFGETEAVSDGGGGRQWWACGASGAAGGRRWAVRIGAARTHARTLGLAWCSPVQLWRGCWQSPQQQAQRWSSSRALVAAAAAAASGLR